MTITIKTQFIPKFQSSVFSWQNIQKYKTFSIIYTFKKSFHMQANTQQQSHHNIALTLTHAFGSTCSFKYNDAIAICDEDTDQAKIMFPAGKTIAKKYIDRQQMDFVRFQNSAETIQCIHILPKKTHIATSQKLYGSNLRVIRLYNVSPNNANEKPQTIKIFPDKDQVGIIKSIVFSASQPHFMCCLVGQPHNKLIYIDVSRNKPLAESNFTVKDVQKITISPKNSHLICTSGSNFIRFLKVEEYAFKPYEDVKKLPKNRKFLNHAWYRNKMVLLVTDRCEVLVIQENKFGFYEVKQEYQNVFNEPNGDKILITALCPFSKGFILGSNNGKFCLWIRKQHGSSYEQQKLQLVRKWATTQERASNVTGIAISQKQDILAISLQNNDIATIFLNQLMPQATDFQLKQSQPSSTTKQILFEYLYKGFHNKPITGMDICLQRPLLATVSHQDSTIRLWNYKNFGCKLLRMFYFRVNKDQSNNPKKDNEEIGDKEKYSQNKPLLTLSFHPSGYYLAVGCTDKLRFFYVLSNQLRPYREIPIKNAHIVKFSQGGHLLACASPIRQSQETSSHQEIVHIFNSITLEQIHMFNVHQSIIRSLIWKDYDENLCSISEKGTLVEWRTSDWKQVKRIHKHEYKYENCTYYHTRNEIIVFAKAYGKNFIHRYWSQQSGTTNSSNNNQSTSNTKQITISDSKNKQSNTNNNNMVGNIIKFQEIEIDMKIMIMKEIIINNKSCLVVGLQNGSLIVLTVNAVGYHKNYRPLHSLSIKSQHMKSITEICVSPCNRFLMTTGKDCMIFVYQARLEINGVSKEEDFNNVVDDFLADVVMYPKNQIIKYEEKEKEYTKILSNLERKLMYISEQAEKKHAQKVHQLELQKNRVIQDLKYRISRVNQQLQMIKDKNRNALDDLDTKNFCQAEILQQKYQQKIEFEKQKYFQLEQEIIQQKMMQQNRLKQLQAQKMRQVQLIKQQFKGKFKESEEIFTKSKNIVNQATNAFEEKIKHIESEQQDQLRQLQERLQHFKTDRAISKEDLEQRIKKAEDQYKQQHQERDQRKIINEDLQYAKRKVEKEVEQARQKLKELKVQYEEKIEILKNKQGKINEFEKKVNDLQKKKHILSYKATQMKKALEPKEMQIDKLKADLMKLKKQFQSSVERKQKLVLYMERIEKERQFLQKQVAFQENQTLKSTNNLDQIIYEIYSCVEHNKGNPDTKVYSKELIKLYHKYVERNDKKDDNHDSKGVEEMTKQIVHLEKSLFQINRSNQKNITRKHEEITKRINENAELITNLNDVKKENQELDRKIKAKNAQIDKLTNIKNDLMSKNAQLQQANKNMDDQSQFSIQSFKLAGDQKDIQNNLLRNKKSNLLLDSYHNKQRNQAELLGNLKKRQNQLVSELQFLTQRIHKTDFFTKQIRQNVRKHYNVYKCEGQVINFENANREDKHSA